MQNFIDYGISFEKGNVNKELDELQRYIYKTYKQAPDEIQPYMYGACQSILGCLKSYYPMILQSVICML